MVYVLLPDVPPATATTKGSVAGDAVMTKIKPTPPPQPNPPHPTPPWVAHHLFSLTVSGQKSKRFTYATWMLKAPVPTPFLEGFKTDIIHDRVLGMSVNIPTKPFCPPMCFLFVCSESYFYTFGCIDWVGWRLAHGEDGRGWPTRVPQEIPNFSCKMSAIVRHLINFNEGSPWRQQHCLKYRFF